MAQPGINYVMGHDERERRRLTLQASVLNPFTEQFLRRAGVAPGMRVLDLGCGVGEVSLVAGRLVGPRGTVTGLDIDEPALEAARRKAEAAGMMQVRFQHADLRKLELSSPADAVIGRHILIHTPDAPALLSAVHSLLERGGLAAFQEFDFSVIHAAYPEAPLYMRTMRVFRDFFAAAAHGSAGTRLFQWFQNAGFGPPDCRAEYPIDGGAESPFYEWITESLRSILPRAEALGIVSTETIQIDTLEQRLRAEAVGLRAGIPGPCMVGCSARKC